MRIVKACLWMAALWLVMLYAEYATLTAIARLHP